MLLHILDYTRKNARALHREKRKLQRSNPSHNLWLCEFSHIHDDHELASPSPHRHVISHTFNDGGCHLYVV